MKSKDLYLFIAAAVFILIGLLGWAVADPFQGGISWWGYASAALGFLLLAYGVWMSRTEIRGGIRLRSTRSAFQVVLMVIIVISIQVIVELFSLNHWTRWDMTPGGFYSLSPKTRQLLKKVDREGKRIEFLAFTQKTSQPMIKEVLEQYARQTKQVTFRFVDLDANPAAAKKYDVDAYGTIVVVHQFEKKETVKADGIPAKASAPPAIRKVKKTFRSEKIYNLSENAVANAILKTIQTAQKKAYFLTGHGERLSIGQGRQVYSGLATAMRGDNYEVSELLLLREKGVPAGTRLLVIAAPRQDLVPAEIEFLEKYLLSGGRILVFLEPETQGLLLTFLTKLGFRTPQSVVIDPQSVRLSLVGGNEVTPFVVDYGLHEITKQLRGSATMFPTVRRVGAKADPSRGILAETLARTGKGSYTVERLQVENGKVSFDPKTKQPGPVPIAAAITISLDKFAKGNPGDKKSVAKGEGRVVVFGDADFASNAFVSQQSNANLVLNAVNWLGGEKALIAIRPKSRGSSPLLLTSGETNFVRLFTLVLLPLFIVLAGASVYIWRRKLQ